MHLLGEFNNLEIIYFTQLTPSNSYSRNVNYHYQHAII